MNCLEFRRNLMQDPYANHDELVKHEATCNTCAAFAQDLRTQEIRLRAILNNVAPPPELAAKIQFAVRLEQRKARRHQAWYAMAASVLLFVGVSFFALIGESWERGNMVLAQSMLKHIQDEPRHLHKVGPVPNGQVKFVFQRFGANLKEEMGTVNFAAECLMRKRNGIHLVLPGKKAPITVFYMPGEHVAKDAPVTAGKYQGEIVATKWGSVAVLGEAGEPLQGLAKELAGKVNWPGHQLGQQPMFNTKTRLAQHF